MIQAEPDPQKRDEYLQRLMELPNQVSFLFFLVFAFNKLGSFSSEFVLFKN